MTRCSRVAAALLLQLNLLLAAYGGMALATAARLKWDPSTYVALRALLPREYRAAAGAAAAAGALQLALAHLAAAAALLRPAAARACYVTYAVATGLLLLGEVAFCAWLWLAVHAWLRSPAAAELLDALRLREHARPLLAFAAKWHPLPAHLDALIQEASADVPRNAYVAVALGALLLLLQPAAVALASLATPPRTRVAPASSALARRASSHSSGGVTAWLAWLAWPAWPAWLARRHGPASAVTFVVRIRYGRKPPRALHP